MKSSRDPSPGWGSWNCEDIPGKVIGVSTRQPCIQSKGYMTTAAEISGMCSKTLITNCFWILDFSDIVKIFTSWIPDLSSFHCLIQCWCAWVCVSPFFLHLPFTFWHGHHLLEPSGLHFFLIQFISCDLFVHLLFLQQEPYVLEINRPCWRARQMCNSVISRKISHDQVLSVYCSHMFSAISYRSNCHV